MVSALLPVSAVPGGFEFQGEPPSEMLDMMAAVQQGELERAAELEIHLLVDGPFRQPEQVDSLVRQRAAEMNRVAIKRNFAADMQPLNPLDPPAAVRLRTLHVPTLVIAGALDNPEILRAADVMAQEINGAKKLILPDSAHMLNMEKPAVFNAAVLNFLSGVG
jgi:pimeloyl-ACP methyl ester carboxylesterase